MNARGFTWAYWQLAAGFGIYQQGTELAGKELRGCAVPPGKNERRIDVMSRWCTRWLALTLLSLSVGACRLRDSGRVDSLALRQDAAGPRLRVAIIGRTNDPRISAAREAVDYWNAEFLRLGRRFRLDAPVVRTDSISDALLRAASGEAVLGAGPATSTLRRTLSAVPADIVIALSQTDLISFGVRWRPGQLGAVGIRRADVWPLSLPNTVRERDRP
ncbi:MAG: hypothetical protein IPK33_11465 [Gemmatimonadetes bacterium]|nr:hypothetical protein [Gemmatimonadota bacterium]